MKEEIDYMAKLYYLKQVDTYHSESMPWFGILSYSVPIYGLFYEDTELHRGGKKAMEKILDLCNGAFYMGCACQK